MRTLIQTDEITTEFYPKIHALNDGSFVLIHAEGEEELVVERFLMESTVPLSEDDRFLTSEGIHGTYLIRALFTPPPFDVWVYPSGAYNDGTNTNGFIFTEDTTPQAGLFLEKGNLGWGGNIDMYETYDTGHNLIVIGERFVGGVS